MATSAHRPRSWLRKLVVAIGGLLAIGAPIWATTCCTGQQVRQTTTCAAMCGAECTQKCAHLVTGSPTQSRNPSLRQEPAPGDFAACLAICSFPCTISCSLKQGLMSKSSADRAMREGLPISPTK